MTGWYSQQAIDAGCGSSIYSTENGGTVEVTCVCRDKEAEEQYKWPDKKCVGNVVQWLRKEKVSRLDHYFQKRLQDYDKSNYT